MTQHITITADLTDVTDAKKWSEFLLAASREFCELNPPAGVNRFTAKKTNILDRKQTANG